MTATGLSLAVILIVAAVCPITIYIVNVEKKDCQYRRPIAEAIFFNSVATLLMPLPASLLLNGSSKHVAGLCFGTILIFIAMRFRLGLSPIPPSPRYIWNAEKTLYNVILKKDHP
ncbi:hypothetical protein ACT3SZ_11100 [Corynebacterium sp. AOP40-9SA-29]|uniref:hypothetical protein n=1 Tax=Corynebacterium sp. AOP40-9SA-29 TaxID=3457677 RepID=UPI0040332FF5